MAIVFRKVYRLTGGGTYAIVLAPVVLPGARGVWFRRASVTHPESQILGTVFEGSDDKFTVLAEGDNAIFEPLTLRRFDEMKDSVEGYQELRPVFRTDQDLQDWYWEEFVVAPDGTFLDHDAVYAILKTMGS